MTTAYKLTSEQLLAYTQSAPEKASVLLRHEDGRILAAVEYKRGSGFWYPDGRVSSLQGIFDDVEVIAIRHEGYFMNFEDYLNRNTGRGGKRADRMMEQQQKLDRARKNEKPQSINIDAVHQMQSEAVSLQDLPDIPPQVALEQELARDSDERVSLAQIRLLEHAETMSEFAEELLMNASEADDFVSITDLEGDQKRYGGLFMSLRSSGQVVLNCELMQLIGDKSYDIQVSQSKRAVKLILGKGKLKAPKSSKLSCVGLVRLIHKIKGMKGDPMKEACGRIYLKELVPGVYFGSF